MSVSSGTSASVAGVTEACSARTVWVMRCLCLAGLCISSYLAWTALNMAPVFGCGSGDVFNCDHVLTSKWSKVAGLPVSVPAAALYGTLLVMLAFARRPASRELSALLWNGITLCGIMAGLAALWFIGLQVFVLSHYCQYCLAAHTCSLLLAGLLLSSNVTGLSQKALGASFGFVAVAAMAGLQIVTPAPENFEVVRYDDVYPMEATDGSSGSDADIFEAPDGVFESPGELFEAPGELFEAPGVTEESRSAEVPAVQTPNESVKADTVKPVASTLLLIVPHRLRMMSHLFGGIVQESPTAAGSSSPSASAENAGSANADSVSPGAENAAATTDASESRPAEVPERRLITVAGNRVTLDVQQWPLLGKPEARYVFVEMFDYTCPHCRNTHFAIKGAQEQYGDDLAILALAVPLERSCNDAASGGGHFGACELARIAITVWRVSPSKFAEFHDWMFQTTRSPSAARLQAEKLVGADKFKQEYDSSIPEQYVKRHVALYKKVGQGSVPKLLFPKSTINGEINSKATLVGTIERELKGAAAR